MGFHRHASRRAIRSARTRDMEAAARAAVASQGFFPLEVWSQNGVVGFLGTYDDATRAGEAVFCRLGGRPRPQKWERGGWRNA